jgi:stage II sporulation protein M
MAKNKTFSLKENYLKSWKFITESRDYIYIATAAFFIFALIAFFVPIPDYLRQEIIKILKEIMKKTEGLSQFEMIKFILFNNVQSSFLGVVLGVFLGIFPLFFAAFNGYVLGFVALLSVEAGGAGVLWRILPHGIFELPAVFISLGLGLRMGMLIFQSAKIKSFKDYFGEFIRVFILVVLPLLAIAAIIEGSLMFLLK